MLPGSTNSLRSNEMNRRAKLSLAVALLFCNGTVFSQQRPTAVGPIASDQFRSTYIRIDNADDGLLYEPVNPGPNARIALVLSHPIGNTFGETPVVEMAKRGYRVLAVNHHGDTEDVVVLAQPLSRAIGYL